MTGIPWTPGDVLPPPSPIIESGDAEAVGGYLYRVGAGVDEFRSAVANAAGPMDAMRGTAVRAVSSRANLLLAGATQLASTVDDARQALHRYAEAVSDVHARARLVAADVETALDGIRDCAHTVADIAARKRLSVESTWDAPPPARPPESVEDDGPSFGIIEDFDSANWTRAVQRWQESIAAIHAAQQRWRNLSADRESSEWALAAALRRTALGSALGTMLGPGGEARRAEIAAVVSAKLTGSRPWDSTEVRTLIGGTMAPEAAAAAWQRIVDSGADVDRLLREHCFELAHQDGLPFWAQDRAGRAALASALTGEEGLRDAFARMGFAEDDRSLVDFEADLVALRRALNRAEADAIGGDVVQLVGFGRHDGAVTGGVALGDLDTASTVGVFVSGMRSDVRGIGDAFGAFKEIRGDATGTAMVTWIGYRSPTLVEEPFQDRAERGRFPLASFLDGVSVRRRRNRLDRFVVMGHSYGSNVAAEAVKITVYPVDALVTIGSAGLKRGTASGSLNASELHATHAKRDNIAPIGRNFGVQGSDEHGGIAVSRVDPRKLPGVHEFSSERSAHGRQVTMHNLLTPVAWPRGMQWAADAVDGTASADEVGYLDPRSTTVIELGKIMRNEWR